MDDILLPRHVIDRLEHRWTARLQQDTKAWSSEKERSLRLRPAQCGPRGIPNTIKRSRRAAAAALRADPIDRKVSKGSKGGE
jgi:hypothetical protein